MRLFNAYPLVSEISNLLLSDVLLNVLGFDPLLEHLCGPCGFLTQDFSVLSLIDWNIFQSGEPLLDNNLGSLN